MDNYYKYLRSEEVDWSWNYDSKTRVHRLTLIHTPTNKSVSGEIKDSKVPRGKMSEKKRELQEDLRGRLEDLVFNE